MSYTFAVGDIHGCSEAMERLIAFIEEYAASGTIVFLGDYIDRGSRSDDVLKRLMDGPKPGWNWICLKGNHEDMMCGAYAGRSERSWWLDNGGLDTEMSFGGRVPNDCLAWAQALPAIHVDEHRIFAHAGVSPEFPLDRQSERDLLWLRVPLDYSGDYWGKHLVHGHTPSDKNPKTVGNRTNIDSACVFGGFLTAAVFDDDTPGAPIEFIKVEA